MFVLAFASLKGGVGKTTNAGLTSLELASRFPGRVLAIDLDPNNNLTDFLLRCQDVGEIESRNIGHVLQSRIQLRQAIYPCCLDQGLSVIPAVPRLAEIGKQLSGNPGVLLKFPTAIQKSDYDWVVIDSPPALTLELSLALYASNYVAVPAKANRWTLQAFSVIQEEVNAVIDAVGKGPIVKTLPSICTEKQNAEIRALLPDFPFTTSFIPKNSAIETLVDAAVTLKVGSKAQIAVSQFVDEVVTWQKEK
jgi:chromosome partitioning protein